MSWLSRTSCAPWARRATATSRQPAQRPPRPIRRRARRRPARAVGMEEAVQWTWQSETSRSPHPDTLAGLAEDLTGGHAPQREPNLTTGRKASAPPAGPPAAAPTAEPVSGADQNLAEMAHRLEAALRRPDE